MIKISTILLFLAFINFPNNIDIKLAKGEPISCYSKKQDSIDKFWDWFQKNEKRLRDFEHGSHKSLIQIAEKGHKIQKGVFFELDLPQNGVINMTISADGVKELFPIVQNIVDKAPKIQGWSFIAFRQRTAIDELQKMTIKVGDIELNPNEMKFIPIVTGDILDVTIYTNSLREDNFVQVAYSGLILIDHIIGEYDCVMKIRSYNFENIPIQKEELDKLIPLLEIRNYVDAFYAIKKQKGRANALKKE